MFPALIVSPLLGGPIADHFDKRKTMVWLDSISSLVAFLLFPAAARARSKALLYISVVAMSTADAVYNPAKNSMLPFMLKSDAQVNKATQLMAISWSLMGAIGAAVGGMLTGLGGVTFCFYVDGFTFAVSAWLIYRVGNGWKLKESAAEGRKVDIKGSRSAKGAGEGEGDEEEEEESLEKDDASSHVSKMLGGVRYLLFTPRGKRLAPLVFFKAFGCALWGSADVCNVVFANGSDYSLGIIFAAVGIGCLVGPVAADKVLDRNRGEVEPRKMVWACYAAVVVVAASFLGMGGNGSRLGGVVFWTLVRSAGSAVLWVYSSVLLQILVEPDVLGRVIAIEVRSRTGDPRESSRWRMLKVHSFAAQLSHFPPAPPLLSLLLPSGTRASRASSPPSLSTRFS
jgi:MFS family permease